MRQQYRRHREALMNMIADAPTEHLAAEYTKLLREIDGSLEKLDELDPHAPAAAAASAGSATRPLETQPVKTDPGRRPLVTPPAVHTIPEDGGQAARSRVAMIIGAGILVLAAIFWLLWRAGSDERPMTPIATEQVVTTTETVAEPEPPVPNPLTAEPAAHDYGAIRKGTRAARQFEVSNNTDQPISIEVARSACRCLFYDYAPVVPPRGKETVTVTVDGSRAKSGTLTEALQVSSKADPSVATTLNVTATVR
jgi:hypothetical protein